MYIIDGIAYAGEQRPSIEVRGVRPLPEHRLWLRFSTGEVKIFDVKPLLKSAAFTPLSDDDVFRSVYIDYGMPVWNNGEIDIAPELVYRDGVAVEDEKGA